MKYILGALLFSFVSSASAQTLVYVSGSGQDTIGNRLVYSVKEAIRRSAGLRLADLEKNGFIRVNIVTLDPDKNENVSGNRTIYSVVWTTQTFHETPVTMYLTSSVGICGAKRVASCAEDIVADTDAQASEVRAWLKKALGSKD